MRTEAQVLSPPRQLPELRPEGNMGVGWRPSPRVLLCLYPTGTPEVWVQVQMEATKSPSFTVRCGFLGSGSVSLVTVSSGGPDGAGGTRLAVLHPEFGIQQWSPACQAHWETKTSISLTVEEGSEGRSPSPNTTFCCKFVSFPEGSQEACGNLFLSTDQGLPAPTPAPILRADLAGIFGVSGVLLFGYPTPVGPSLNPGAGGLAACFASDPPLSPRSVAGRASYTTYTTVNTSCYCPATLDMVLPPRPLSRWAALPVRAVGQPQPPAPWAPLPAPARSSFISMENGLYAQAGERPLQAGPNLVPFPDSLGHRAMEGHLGVR
uniref:PVR related immunoglobulin domain containing n=1 Tax=Ursus americanus TaxID=9643 RepID=A0A452QUQ3_URSAM